jgi:hypothetical protein
LSLANDFPASTADAAASLMRCPAFAEDASFMSGVEAIAENLL